MKPASAVKAAGLQGVCVSVEDSAEGGGEGVRSAWPTSGISSELKHPSLEGKGTSEDSNQGDSQVQKVMRVARLRGSVTDDGQGRGDCLEFLLTGWVGAPGCSSHCSCWADLLALLSWSCPCFCEHSLPC